MDRLITNEVLAEKIDNLAGKVDKIDKLLTGNGEPERGLIVRVDRLESIEATRKWTIRALVTTMLSAGATYFFNK